MAEKIIEKHVHDQTLYIDEQATHQLTICVDTTTTKTPEFKIQCMLRRSPPPLQRRQPNNISKHTTSHRDLVLNSGETCGCLTCGVILLSTLILSSNRRGDFLSLKQPRGFRPEGAGEGEGAGGEGPGATAEEVGKQRVTREVCSVVVASNTGIIFLCRTLFMPVGSTNSAVPRNRGLEPPTVHEARGLAVHGALRSGRHDVANAAIIAGETSPLAAALASTFPAFGLCVLVLSKTRV